MSEEKNLTAEETPASKEARALNEKAEKTAKKGDAEKEAAPTKTPKAKKGRQMVPEGHVYVTASYNNTLMSFTDLEGHVLAQSSAGGCGFKGSRKATPYAATVTAEKLIEKATPYGIKEVQVFITGVGTGREQAVRGLQAAGLEIKAIFDTTPMPHNGCRKKKARRV